MYDKKDIREYILRDKSIFTIESTKINARRTYMFKQQTRVSLPNPPIWNIYMLYGPDNGKDYRWIGCYNQLTNLMSFDPSPRAEGLACRMIMRFMSLLLTTEEWPDTCKFYKSTRCLRCGRKLTTPQSIECGYGPHCMRETCKYE